MMNSELLKEVENFIDNTDTGRLSIGIRNMMCEYLAQNSRTGLSIYLDDAFFTNLLNLFILLDEIQYEKNAKKAG